MTDYDRQGLVKPSTQSGQDIKEDIKERVNNKGVSPAAKEMYRLEKTEPGTVKSMTRGIASKSSNNRTARSSKKSYKA